MYINRDQWPEGMAVDRTSGYRKIEQAFRQQIATGAWPAGERLPPIRKIATQFAVNYTTAHRAIAELQRRGYVESAGRHGSFVSDGWTRTADQPSPANAPPTGGRPLRLGMVVAWTAATAASTFPPILMLERLLMARVLQEGGTFLPLLHPEAAGAAPAAFHRTLREAPVDVVLIPGGTTSAEAELTAGPEQIGKAVIAFAGAMDGEIDGDGVRIDDHWAFREITRRLWQLGHRHIGFVGMPRDRHDLAWNPAREGVWRRTMVTLGARPRAGDALALTADLRAPAGLERFTAIVGVNDATAATVCQALRAAGRRVPEDVSVTGYDNLMVRPEHRELTTFTWPDERLVAAILALARRRLPGSGAEETGDRATLILRPVVVPRATWGPGPAGATTLPPD